MTKICIPFKIQDREYEAVSFLKEGETSVSSEEVLSRVPDAIGTEDFDFIFAHRGELPKELKDYFLVSQKLHPDRPRDVSYLARGGSGWYVRWDFLGLQWDDNGLVLRRRMSDTRTIGDVEKIKALKKQDCDLAPGFIITAE